MRRRLILTAAGIGLGGAAISAAPAAAANTPSAPWRDEALLSPADTLMSTTQLEAGLDALTRNIGRARYREALHQIPRLMNAAESAAHRGGRRGDELLARLYVLATAVGVKERSDLSAITADRAVQAARRSQNPLACAMAVRAQYIVLRQHGHDRLARQVAEQAVSDLEREECARPVVAHLLLESAYGAAQAGRSSDAEAQWEHGRSLARRGPAAAVWLDHPGPMTPDQVARYGLCIQHRLGNSRKALGHMAAVSSVIVPTVERAARIRHDSAKLLRDMDDLPAALKLLQEQERVAPQDARRSSVRYMVSGMLATSPSLPGLRQFAAQLEAA